MKNLTEKQIKEISSFFTTVAATWFGAGVIAPLFTSTSGQLLLLSLTVGLCGSIIFLWASVIIIRVKNE